MIENIDQIEIGIDSFAATPLSNETDRALDNSSALAELLERIEHADKSGLDVFGIGEHYRKEFLDSAPSIILAAAAARTKRIGILSAIWAGPSGLRCSFCREIRSLTQDKG